MSSIDPNALGNNQDIELAWAELAFKFAETHEKLLSRIDGSKLRLTRIDDAIYEHFRKEFPDFDLSSVDDDILKGTEAKKAKWREFCNKYEHQVEDFSAGTLLRSKCTEGYSQENTILVVRIQFYAIEIARNREGHNKLDK
ncbi:hypothetical protein H696_01251 [Fonticula alba]|uniref:Polysaccharide biosynthesis domain-containing protein n=1 Tax=Fonticula alba TaxID=691883 RepID=A0A058ZEF0_FONAL|nr:hypothetical protein H696_01251 [Fonticula alba]KCV71832.1 hypothetical protein H696_01251 [Fonticula alba]|eukprot:XP_009493410.1 hypothetical protein H696_01251 [Fonticula alba]